MGSDVACTTRTSSISRPISRTTFRDASLSRSKALPVRGTAQAAYDGALAYLTGAMAGSPGLHTDAAAKGPAIADMLFAVEAARALYYRAVSEARVDSPPDVVQRARAAFVTVQRSVIAVTQEAIRVCGGRALLKRYPLERYARDARAGALMRPWTQEIATQQAWEAALRP